MLGKTFKGLTDDMLAWQTAKLLELEIARDGILLSSGAMVVEIAFNDLQASPHYPGGLALRFARVKRYRPDKIAAEADTFAAVRGGLRAGMITACRLLSGEGERTLAPEKHVHRKDDV